MRTFYKILLIIIGIAYLISPIDLIPDFLVPYIGWLDDALVLWLIFYYLKFNRLPSFFYRQKKTGQTRQNGADNRQNNSNNYDKGRSFNDYNAREQDHNHGYSNTWSNNRNRNSENNQTGTSGGNNSTYHTKKTPYEILGIDKNATEKEIRTAYRKLAKQYHPDRVANLGKEFQELANKKFIEIKEAYNILMKY